MALFSPTFVLGVIVLLYLSSFVLFAVIRIITGVSIQRLGYFSLRRIAFTPREGLKIEIRSLGLNVHRPTFAQPTWLSIRVNELVVTADIGLLEGQKPEGSGHGENKPNDGRTPAETNGRRPRPKTPQMRRDGSTTSRSETWKHLTRIKERIKRLHRQVKWLRMIDVVATNSTLNVVDVGNVQFGSFTIAVDTRRKMVDRARFFLQGRSQRNKQQHQAEWIMTLRSVLFTTEGNESMEILDHATLNVHGYLYEALDGLRDAAIALKLGRVHIPYDDLVASASRYRDIQAVASALDLNDEVPAIVVAEKVVQELDEPGSSNSDLVQAVSDSKEFVSSILRGIKEVQFAVSFVGFTKRIQAVKTSGEPILLNAEMKEIGIDLHRLDPKSPAHRMYFPSTDIAHEALAAALSIAIGLDDGHGKADRIMYIPMATTTVRTTLPSKTVELTDSGSAEERNANILFANSVITSPSLDLVPRHLPLLLAMLRHNPRPAQPPSQHRHMIISRLLPKANIKFSMHEPVIRIALPPVSKSADPDDTDLIISSISSISLDVESFHSAIEDLHYSLASTMRLQTHRLYYQTWAGVRFDLLETESFDLKVQLSASPHVHVVATGTLQTFSIKMVRKEISDGLRHIVRQLRLNVEPDKHHVSKTARHPNFLRGLPDWLLHFQIQASDFSMEVAGVDHDISEEARGVALQLDSWSAEYRAQRLDGFQRRATRRRASSRALITPEADLLKAGATSHAKKEQYPGDGRRVAIHVRGLEAYVMETEDRWEMDPFVSLPRFEVAFSTESDSRGAIFRVHSHIRTLLLQYSLYKHYAVGMAVTVLRTAFVRRLKDRPEARSPRQDIVRQYDNSSLLRPPAGDDAPTNQGQELLALDVTAALVQVKAEMPADPPLLLQIYDIKAGRHRWSTPFFRSKLIRLYAEAPRMRRVWARVVSIKGGRVEYLASRRKSSSSAVVEDRSFDVAAEAIRLAIPHELIFHKLTDNFVNVFKAVKQLHHRFKTGTNEYILEKGPEGPKHVPKVSVRVRQFLFELEDGAFEWKLGMIYRAGRVEQKQRLARDEAFRVKVKKIHEEELKKQSGNHRTRSVNPRGRTSTGTPWKRSRSADDQHGRSGVPGGRRPRYDPEGGCQGLSGAAHVTIAEARQQLNVHNAQSWKRNIDRHYTMARNGMNEIRGLFFGRDDVPEDLEDHEDVLEIPARPALMSTLIFDLRLMIDKPSFPMKELPEFLHKIGKGMPRDMLYSLLIPMNVQIEMGEARVSLRDYPLPLLHVPSIKAGQPSRLKALSLRTDFVIAEEFRGVESTRRVKVDIIPPRSLEPGTSNEGCFAIDVRRTIGPVKSYSDVSIDINTAHPTRFTWGPSYQPAIQDMMMVIESFTKPVIDPSPRVGFWDKIRLAVHSRVRVSWKGDGDVHLALKGTRDPYQVTGNGAGFLMCWRNDVVWSIHSVDNAKRFMSVDSGEYVLAIPDYSHHFREARRQNGEGDSVASDDGYKTGAAFKKVVMKLSGKVQWLVGLKFERAMEEGHRSFDFKPHYKVLLKSPHYAKDAGDGLPYDAYRGFRSQYIHMSIAVRAPVDREWSVSNTEPSRSYNTVHLTPRFFTHFFSWWSLFHGPLSLPIRQGSLWPNREKSSKKFGRHLATIKYSLLLAPLFLSHIYKHKELEDYAESAVSATGIKVRFDSFMLDLHQRREAFNTMDKGRKTTGKTSGMKIHAAQLDLASADIRAVSASIRGTTSDAVKKSSLANFVTQQEDDDTDLSRFTIPDNDLSWIDVDDFVELDWILPTEPNPDTKILPLAYAPRITYFRQTDIGGVIGGDPERTSPFGQEDTHFCIMSLDNPRGVQAELLEHRLGQLDKQLQNHNRKAADLELRAIRDASHGQDLRSELETLNRQTALLTEKRGFVEKMLQQLTADSPRASDSEADEPRNSETSLALDDGMLMLPRAAEFESDYKNRFVIHNIQLKWNNLLRNIILRYIHQVSQRRGFVYYQSRPAVKFILDIVEEQLKSKLAKGGAAANTASPVPGSTATPDPNGGDRQGAKDIEDRIRRILQDGRKFVNADESSTGDVETSANVATADLTSGIAQGFTPQKSYHLRLIAPQIQLQSDKNKKHVVLVTAKGMELKVVEVLDKDRVTDNVSGLVQRRFFVNMDSTQFFVTHQKWFASQLLSMYSGSTYGTPSGMSWPPWVPVEVMFDFKTDPFGFKRVVQKTSAMLRYDKYNTLRLKYNDEVNTGETSSLRGEDKHEKAESRMDNLWVEFPQAHALCNSSQYYAMYVIVLDLLMYSEPLEKTRSERLEKIMLASDFSDLRGAPELVTKLQDRIRELEEIKTYFQVHSKYLDVRGWEDRLVLERDLAACEDELFFVMKAITTSQRKFESTDETNALLKWTISAREIVWHLIRDTNEPLVELQLKDVEYDRTDNSDGSHINLIRVGKILGLNLLPEAIYPEMIGPYIENEKSLLDTDSSQPMIRVYWYMLEAIAGIPVMDHFEVNLFPMKIQLERDVGKKLFEYIFPGTDGPKKPSDAGLGHKSDSPFMLKPTFGGGEEDEGEDDDGDSLSNSVDRLTVSSREKDGNSSIFSTRPGSLELRLRPTLTSDVKTSPLKQKALSIHSGEGHAFRLFRSGNNSRSASKKPSYESLRSGATSRPGTGIRRTSTGFSTHRDNSSTHSTEPSSKKLSSRLTGLRGTSGNKSSHGGSSGNADDKGSNKQADDLSMMLDRASSYMTFAYIKMPSVVLCLSYKGKGDRNLEDVHDFVFKLPTIEYRNKTWSNLDLALALKSRVIKALISHTGAIIGNKFSKHRPNTAQQNRLRELATSSVLLNSTPQLSTANLAGAGADGSRDGSGDDSAASSLFGTSPVDYSRSPPRSIRSSQASLRDAPAGQRGSASRSSSVASSQSRKSSGHHALSLWTGRGNNNGNKDDSNSAKPGGLGRASSGISLPSFLKMTPPTPRDEKSASSAGLGEQDASHLQRPGTGSSSVQWHKTGLGIGFGGDKQTRGPAPVRAVTFGNSTTISSGRPGSSASTIGKGRGRGGSLESAGDQGHGHDEGGDRRRSAGGGGFLKEKFSALTSRLKEQREGSVLGPGYGGDKRENSQEVAGKQEEEDEVGPLDEKKEEEKSADAMAPKGFGRLPRTMTG
jgi:hypothetical protein